MPIRQQDIQWWLREVKLHPGSASAIIRSLAERLEELDRHNEELRAELIRMRRSLGGRGAPVDTQHLQQQGAGARHPNTRPNVNQRSQSARGLARDVSSLPHIIMLSRLGKGFRAPIEGLERSAQDKALIRVTPTLARGPHLLATQPDDELVLLTQKGKGLFIPVKEVPLKLDASQIPLQPIPAIQLDPGDSIAAIVSADQLRGSRWITLVTRGGFVRQTILAALERQISRADDLIASPLPADEPLLMLGSDMGDDVLLFTHQGKWTRFPGNAIPGRGAVGIELQAGDEVVDAASLKADREFLVLTSDGFAFRRSSERLKARSRPGGAGKAMLRRGGVLTVVSNMPIREVIWFSDRNGVRLSQLPDGSPDSKTRSFSLADLFEEVALAAIAIAAPVG